MSDIRPPTPEEAWREGAEAMRGLCAALAVGANQFELALKMLATPLPAFQMPEKQTVAGPDVGEAKP